MASARQPATEAISAGRSHPLGRRIAGQFCPMPAPWWDKFSFFLLPLHEMGKTISYRHTPAKGSPTVSRIHVLHENSAWLPPLAQAFDQRRLPWTEWFLDAGTFDLALPPPTGVFYNRMSASSH